MTGDRRCLHAALASLEQEAARSADTHLLRVELAAFPGIVFHFKDEASHPTGSLKHRLARSLFLYALCNGRLHEGQGAIDASSGSTAISEAGFARLLGVSFTAVMPECTAPAKVRLISELGAQYVLLPPGMDASAVARQRASREGLCYLDQFGRAERATDWRGNNNIAESILEQMSAGPDPEPAWIVCGVGTGGQRTDADRGHWPPARRAQLCLRRGGPRGGSGRRRFHRCGVAT